MNLTQLKAHHAAMHRKTVTDFNTAFALDASDIITPAINAAARKAQNLIDFEFSNLNADLAITATTWTGSLTNAKLVGTSTPVSVKRVQHVLIPISGGYIPVEFVTNEIQSDRDKRQLGRQNYDPALTAADYGLGGTSPFAWQQGQSIYFGPSSQLQAASLVTGFTARLSIVKFLPDYVDGETVTVTLSVASPTAQTFTAYGGLLNGSPIYFGNGMALWRNAAGTNWYVTNANVANINVTPPPSDYYQLTTTSTSPAGTYVEHASGTPTCVVGTPTGNTTDFIMEFGWKFLLYESVLQTNRIVKSWATKTEGNLDEPLITAYANEALAELAEWNKSISSGTTEARTEK